MTATKKRIKKLTPDKVQQLRDEIVKRDGQEVDLTGRGIESIVSLEGLETATKLDLSHNKLTKLSQLKSVPRVTMLKLTDNKLNGDGLAEIQHLKKLVILSAAENLVTRIPFEVLRNVRTLKALVLNNNSISAIDWIPKLPDLNSLIVSNNRITQIPQRVVDGLPSLKKISISHNMLKEIPNLSHLSEITELRLSHNRIKTIPAHLAHLKNLKVLELSHNQIDDWSGLEALSSLENLRQLNLIGNPICGKKLAAVPSSVKGESGNSDIDDDEEVSEVNVIDSGEEKKRSKDKKFDISEEEKQQLKEAKKLDAKHKQYNFKMKRLFPNLIVRDAARVLDKRVHGYVAPIKEVKTPNCFDEKKNGSEKRKRATKFDYSKKKKLEATPTEASSEHAKKSSKEKKTQKKHDSEQLAVDKPTTDVAVTSEPETVKHHRQQIKISEVKPAKSNAKDTEAVKEKKRKDKKKIEREPKEIASGVVAVKQFKKAKKATSAESKPVDLTQINFTPAVGFGGASAWD